MTDSAFVPAGDLVAGGPGGRPAPPPPFPCGESQATFPLAGQSAGHATREAAIQGVLDELVWPMFDAVDAAYDFRARTCPPSCPKRERVKPRLVPVRHHVDQDEHGKWTCTIVLRLVVVVRCKNEVELAALPSDGPVGDAAPLEGTPLDRS